MSVVRTAAAVFSLLLFVGLALSQDTVSTTLSPAVRSMERKLEHIETDAQAATPDATPTVLTGDEVNAYVNSGAVQMPKGVQRVHLKGLPEWSRQRRK